MFQNIKNKINSDKAAINTIETILLIALAVFAVMGIFNYIMKPIQESSQGIGSTIKEMNPKAE